MTTPVSTSVARTAADALNAKASALSVGYKPVHPHGDLYATLLGRLSSALSESGEKSGAARDRASGRNKSLKRQTPLVNAGYAARMAAVSHAVGRFVLAHHSDSLRGPCEDVDGDRKPINIVLVGCGMEVLGIWASALSSCPSLVYVYEIDCEQICTAKRLALRNAGFVSGASSSHREGAGSTAIRLSGTTSFRALQSKQQQKIPDFIPAGGSHYTLMASDLRNVSSIRKAMLNASFDHSYPTVVVSELVLAYLGQSYSNKFLEYISSEVCKAKNSLCFAYEPIGAETPAPGYPLVVGGYVEDYCEKFHEKLNRGRHDNDSIISDADSCDVLGKGCMDTLSRFFGSGFGGPMGCCVAGIAASVAFGGKMTTRELFDEHLELAIHLQCYGTVSAFSHETDRSFAYDVCPWFQLSAASTHNCRVSDISEFVVLQDKSKIKISPIKNDDQERVREIFQTAYAELFDAYPSVRKLVKSALKTDLSGHSDVPCVRGASAINERYSCEGGGFWVATIADGNSVRKVVGCIGIRPNIFEDETTYEIQRLAVDDEYRSRGIGGALLCFVENFMSSISVGRNSCKVLATTPAVLDSANHFYKKRGYDCKEEKLVGKMVMNTYIKTL
mmetsp:Transcript_25055/g.54623  ORF Transcript_25055/g.54623 Transcript_25055/m.54623 type:complete len:617 (+) Transcript_25055:82-1932(+)|eukprot:CAMPEP_0178489664 /NCGR_PEP_ID=MMETSP0696-20121128/10495_1 /TAXON_ID=265572 /ORGANISM="Extubocellulus spinifer, Strain CCMP396" /LENGTH=616 /DNA_ID=CAMNT_0020117477 /DNA_START=1 /DNA_END=1851 /DNA_ORIENTATION=+